MTTSTSTTDDQARATVDAAAEALGWTTGPAWPPREDEPEPEPFPCKIHDPSTGRALFVRRLMHPRSVAGRLAIFPDYPRETNGKAYLPQRIPSHATTAPDIAPATLAKRLARYLAETAPHFAEAQDKKERDEAHNDSTQATIAALVAAGWTPPRRHSTEPSGPELANGYFDREQVSGGSVSFQLRGLTLAQALAVTAALVATA